MKTLQSYLKESLNENFASDIVKNAQDLEVVKPYTWDDIGNLADWADEETLPKEVDEFVNGVIDGGSKYKKFVKDVDVVLPKGTQLFFKKVVNSYIMWDVVFKDETYGAIMVASDMVDELKNVTVKLGQ